MGIITRLPPGLDEVDVIIAGGGTAGCVVASRLSDAEPGLVVLVVEGGQDNYNEPCVVHPLLFTSNVMPTSKNTLFYRGVDEPELGNRRLTVPSGGVLGGGSSINFMTYSRAQRLDFDSWKTPGWNADELLPYMKKLETYHGPGTTETHGVDGPVHVSKSTFCASRSEHDFIQASAKVGIPEKVDIQDLDTGNAVQRNLRYISPQGRRQDAAHTYLHPRLRDGEHENLHVLLRHQVVRVLFDKKKAVGVEYRPNPVFHDDATAVKTVRARKLVVVSAGALGSPLVLERSGIGDAAILEKAGVAVVAELPGVGGNYMDHHLLIVPYRSSLSPNETADALYHGRVDIGDLIAAENSMLGWNVADVTSKVRPTDEEAAALGPAFLEAWNRDFKDFANRPVAIITSHNRFLGDVTGLAAAQFVSASIFTAYPYSRGHVHITGPAMGEEPDFKTGILTDAQGLDVKMCMWAYKKQREIMRRMSVYRGEHVAAHPPFAAKSDAACREVDGPLEDVRDIVYTDEDDAVLERWIRQNVGSTWHSSGTCKMAPREEGGVVDGSLGVYGVEGLKVADLSIPPQNVGANTGNTAFVVGERAADIFISELGLARCWPA